MNILILVLGSLAVLVVVGRFYSRLISRVLGEDPTRPTPALTLNDGRDFVPTRTPVVFAHHFASIAGAGPILGPVLAMYYGWAAALAWLLIGGLFIGAVHDYAATHIALREGGRSIVHVARKYLGKTAFIMLAVMVVALLAAVCAAFLDASASSLGSKIPLADLGLDHPEKWFRILTEGPEKYAKVGGISSMSVVVITACAPVIGYLYIKRKTPVWICSLLALLICGVAVAIGLLRPVAVSPGAWKMMVSLYVLAASGLPVWMLIQSRDFINVHILYIGIGFLLVSLVAAGLGGAAIQQPASNLTEAAAIPTLGPVWPVLFITIACGAISGFHSLCAGGTTCKQLTSERAARQVGYFAMLLETFLAVCVVGCLIVGLSLTKYAAIVYPAEGRGNVVLGFGMAVGNTAAIGFGWPKAVGVVGAMLMLEGFLITTLDTAVRLTRYLLEEIWASLFGEPAQAAALQQTAGSGSIPVPTEQSLPGGRLRAGLMKVLQHYWFNSALAVVLMLILSFTKSYQAIWGLFASGNQLLAAVGLLLASVWLVSRGKTVLFTLIPGVLVLVTTLTNLLRLLFLRYLPAWRENLPLLIADVVILAMATGVLVSVAVKLWQRLWLRAEVRPAAAD